jgi:hypothetical protein
VPILRALLAQSPEARSCSTQAVVNQERQEKNKKTSGNQLPANPEQTVKKDPSAENP